jgi:hypothetical protein
MKIEKGSYRRRIEDADNVIQNLKPGALLEAATFLALYFACEKLAKGLVGIRHRMTAEEAYGLKFLRLAKVKEAAETVGIPFSDDELDRLFEVQKPPKQATSGRTLRDRAVHDFGPTNIRQAAERGGPLIPLMTKFLACHQQILAYHDSRKL